MRTPPETAAGVDRLPLPLLLGGAAGSVTVAIGALGSAAAPVDGGWPELPRTLGTVLVAVGVVVLVAAWWRTRRVLYEVTPGAIVRATALWAAPLLLAPPLLSRDVYSYAGQALVAARGLDPYTEGPSAVPGTVADNVDEVWRDKPSPYGPAFLGPASLLLRLTGDDVVPALLLLRLLAVLGLVLTAVALPVLARACGVPATRALWLGLANPLGLLHGVAGAHNDALMVGLLVAGAAVAVTTARWPGLLAAGALVALAGLVKAPALGALPFLALAVPGVRQRLRAGALLTLGAAGAAVAVSAGTGLGWGWLGTIDSGRARLSLFSPATGVGTVAGELADALGLAEVAVARDAVLTGAVALALLLVAGLWVRTARGPASARRSVQGMGLALLIVVVLSPTVLPWYVLWAVVPLAACTGRRAADAMGAACGVLCLTTWPSGRSVVRPPLYGLPLVIAAGGAFVAWRRRAAADRAATSNS